MVIKDTPQILTRVSMRWLPEPAFEDTRTIALNVGGYFLDLRVVAKDGSLQWSRAGQRKLLKEDPQTFQWTRIIDSLGSDQPDEAAFKTLPNGDDLEYGMFNKDGIPTAYEEVWRDTTTTERSTERDTAWILQSADGRTFVGKIQHTFLGMSQGDGGSFSVRHESKDAHTGVWDVTFQDGQVHGIPRASEASEIEAQVGDDQIFAGQKVQLSGDRGCWIVRGFETL